MRFFIYLSYKGTDYHGWQIQKNANSVQSEIETALGTVFRQPIEIVGSGRTDTGVHASEQVVHFDPPEMIDENDLTYKLNSLLPKDIAIKKIVPVIDTAHARFDASSREYRYYIISQKDPFTYEFAYYFRRGLDIESMNDLEEVMTGWEDFESLSRVKTDVNHFRCNVVKSKWENKDGRLVFTVKANRFLRGMVRALVGTMIDVGMGKLTKADFIRILESRDRRQAGSAVPPHGLFLHAVDYPPEVFKD